MSTELIGLRKICEACIAEDFLKRASVYVFSPTQLTEIPLTVTKFHIDDAQEHERIFREIGEI